MPLPLDALSPKTKDNGGVRRRCDRLNIYTVLAAAYPAGSLASAVPSKFYDGAINGMTGGSQGLALATQSDVTLGGHAGRTFLLTSATGSIKGEVVVVGDTMYMAYVAFTSPVDTGLIDTFLLDFKLSA
jgi:hypothetical protein